MYPICLCLDLGSVNLVDWSCHGPQSHKAKLKIDDVGGRFLVCQVSQHSCYHGDTAVSINRNVSGPSFKMTASQLDVSGFPSISFLNVEGFVFVFCF